MTTTNSITPLDWLMIALYFGVLLCVAWWVVRKSKDSTTDYFLAGRNLGWWIIGASIFASNIGSEHIVGLAGAGATSGVALAHYELHAWCLLILGWVFVPFYMRSMVFTMPEFLEKRLQIGGADIDSFWIGSVLVIALTGLYTVLGGMRAGAYNDAVQVIVLIAGSALLTFYGLNKLGGWGEL